LEAEDNPQKEMAHEIVKEEPMTFGFPIKETDEETKMKNIPHSHSCQTFMGYLKKILIPSSSSLMYFAEAMTM
jgi:hypothetical protein